MFLRFSCVFILIKDLEGLCFDSKNLCCLRKDALDINLARDPLTLFYNTA